MLRQSVFAAVGYTLIVFPFALIWHVGLFEEAYHAFGYFEGEPNIPLGLVTIVLQGILLSIMYTIFAGSKPSFSQAVRFCVLVGAFLWTSHVLALVAKQNVSDAMWFVVMESLYLGLQFGAFAIVLGFVFRGAD